MSEQTTSTQCWNCARAINGWSWAREFIPVKGWNATPIKKNSFYGEFESYIVHSCPEFVRDAYNNGTKRYKEGDDLCDPEFLLGKR